MVQVTYFMLRLTRPSDDGAADERTLQGLAERLATGERIPFGSTAELIGILHGRPPPHGTTTTPPAAERAAPAAPDGLSPR